MLLQGLVDLGRVILEKNIVIFRQCIFAISIPFPLGKGIYICKSELNMCCIKKSR